MGAARGCEMKGRFKGLRDYVVMWEFEGMVSGKRIRTRRQRGMVGVPGRGEMRPEAVRLLYYWDTKGPSKKFPSSPELYIN